MWTGTERRKNKRYGVKNSTVRYLRAGALSFLANYSDRYLLLNISESGLHFITRDQLPVGGALKIQLEFPTLDNPIKVKGKVIWDVKSKEHNAYRTGVKITSISDKGKRFLRHVLDNTLLDNVKVSTGTYLKEIERL